MTYHSEYGQDQYVHSLLPHRDGVFVEIGALDGVLHSNTLFFEQSLGWKGLIIEANPDFHYAIKYHRPNAQVLCCAVSDKAGVESFTKVDSCIGWSGLTANFEAKHVERINSTPGSKQSIIYVPTLDLGTILKSFGLVDIDYMSIDIEGAERKALGGGALNTFRAKVISVEDNWFRPELSVELLFSDYHFLKKIGPDLIFHHESWVPPA